MSYSINAGMYVRKYGMSLDSTLELIKATGFDSLDYTSLLGIDDCLKNAASDIAVIEKHGLSVEQTHGPFNRYNQWGDRFAICLERA